MGDGCGGQGGQGRRVWATGVGDCLATNSAEPLRGDARWDARLLEGRFAIATATLTPVVNGGNPQDRAGELATNSAELPTNN
ncbi:MAG: hypothetical protein ACHBN1_03520 [Heteroscytonema crispum UTEX LB 1556]